MVEIRAGDRPLADQYASECLELARQADSSNAEPVALYGRALVDAHLGRVEAARAAAERGSALAAAMGDETWRVLNEWVLGFLELSLGDPARAHVRLGPLVGSLHAIGVGEPALFPVLPDEIEALIGLGELDQAEPLIEELHARGQALDRAWALATAARGRGLLAAARGDPQDALAHLQRALQEHQRDLRPFELDQNSCAPSSPSGSRASSARADPKQARPRSAWVAGLTAVECRASTVGDRSRSTASHPAAASLKPRDSRSTSLDYSSFPTG